VDFRRTVYIPGNLSLIDLFKYFQLWAAIQEANLSNQDDNHIGDSRFLVFTLPNMLLGHSSIVLSPSNLGRGFGSLGRLQSARFIFGCPLETVVG
jgi:hypothetical protein